MANGEADATQSPDVRASLVLRYGRSAVAGLLLLIVIAAVGAAGPAVGGRGPLRSHALVIGITLEAVLAAFQIALAVRARRSPHAGRLAAVLRSGLRRIAAVVMVVIVVIGAVSLFGHEHGHDVLKIFGGKGKKPPDRLRALTHHPSAGPDNLNYVWYGLIAVVLVAAVLTFAVLIARMRPRQADGYDGEAADESTELRRAVESARTALRFVDDARAAIIACYVAMEGSLARAGTARAAAETPDELLIRAAASGLIHGQAAARLTALFYEARFSSHSLPAAARDDARQALDAISRELRSEPGGALVAAPAAGSAAT